MYQRNMKTMACRGAHATSRNRCDYQIVHLVYGFKTNIFEQRHAAAYDYTVVFQARHDRERSATAGNGGCVRMRGVKSAADVGTWNILRCRKYAFHWRGRELTHPAKTSLCFPPELAGYGRARGDSGSSFIGTTGYLAVWLNRVPDQYDVMGTRYAATLEKTDFVNCVPIDVLVSARLALISPTRSQAGMI
jgi:hypothetical protein